MKSIMWNIVIQCATLKVERLIMTATTNAIWDVVLKAVEVLQSRSDKVVLYKDSKDVFENNFSYYYELIEDNFMSKDISPKSLDRHKVAAVIVCSILKTKVVGIGQKHLEEYKDKEFLGNEKIAFEVALSFMYDELRKTFNEGKIPYKCLFDQYIFPQAFSCDREYGEIICRDLYLSNELFELNPLLLSNLFFFIEEYSFSFNNIERRSNKEE